MSLLLLSSMHHVLLYQKAAHNWEKGHYDFYQLEYVARHLLRMKTSQLQGCVIKQNRANLVIQQVARKKGCGLTVGGKDYNYIVEDLGDYPCLMVKQQKKIKPTHHYRFTVLRRSMEQQPASLVQLRVIKLSTEELLCSGEANYVSTGISSWRYE